MILNYYWNPLIFWNRKFVFLGGFLVHKHGEQNVEEEEEIVSEFITELNRGGLHLPTLSTVYFVHCAINLHNRLEKPRQNCSKYFQNLLSFIDAPYTQNKKACKSLTNVIFKAYALDVSDTEKQIGCLRRKKKLLG